MPPFRCTNDACLGVPARFLQPEAMRSGDQPVLNDDTLCRAGYVGLGCPRCRFTGAAKYYKSRDLCLPCPAVQRTVPMTVALGSVVSLLIFLVILLTPSKLTTLAFLLLSLQAVVAAVVDLVAKAPESLRQRVGDIVSLAVVLLFDPDSLQPECEGLD